MNIKPRDWKKSNMVLVIDDDPEICDALELAASMEGYSVQVADSEETALEMIESSPPALILLDYYMAEHNTERFVSTVRAINRSIPIVLMTGALEPAGKAKELGLKRYLAKPFDIDALQKVLREHGVDRREAIASKRKLTFSLFS